MKTSLALWAFRPDAFTGSARVFARLVCAWTRSEWAHVGVSFDGLYYEADPFAGVVAGPVPENATCVKVWIVRDTRLGESSEWWLNRQLGKPYDWPGILGFVIGPSESGRRDRGRWFCSELAAVVLRRFGIDVGRRKVESGNRKAEIRDQKFQISAFNSKLSHLPAWEITPGVLVKGAVA